MKSIEKRIEDIVVSMDFVHENIDKKCFVVFSSREEHIEIVIDSIEMVLVKEFNYNVIRLDEYLSSGDSQFNSLYGAISESSLGVIILDGFRPNVIFEYGIFKGMDKPCIVLKEQDATIDVQSFYNDVRTEFNELNPLIDMDKNFSDVKDKFYINYNKNNPKIIRDKIRDETLKLNKQIEKEYMRTLIPNKDYLINDIKWKLSEAFKIYSLRNDKIDEFSRNKYTILMNDILRIAKENNINLPDSFHINNCQFFYNLNEYEEAIDWLEKIKTKDDYYLYWKSKIFFNKKDYDNALLILEKAIDKYPEIESFWHNKGLIHDIKEQEDEAEYCYRQGIKLNAKCPGIHYQYGILLFQKKNYKKAKKMLKKALDLDPNDRKIRFWYAKSIIKIDEKDKGMELLKELSQEYPDYSDVWYEISRNKEDDEERLKILDKLIKIDPDHGGALCDKASVLSHLGRLEEAIEIYKDVKSKCSRYDKCITLKKNLSSTLLDTRNFDESLKVVNEGLLISENDEELLKFKLILLIFLDKKKESEILMKDKNINIEDPEFLYNYACALSAKDYKNESIIFLRKSFEIDKKYYELAQSDNDLENIRAEYDLKNI